jgi:hypothetical protein
VREKMKEALALEEDPTKALAKATAAAAIAKALSIYNAGVEA